MSSIMGVSASRGALVETRRQLQFIIKSTEILEMKRDKVASELNKYLGQLGRRGDAEKKIMGAYNKFIKALVNVGHEEFNTASIVVSKMETKLHRHLVMGIEEYDVEIVGKPSVESIPNLVVKEVANEFYKAFIEMLNVAIIENKIEALAYDLMNTARKVNALQKIIIPRYQDLIRYIEERIMEEELSEFVRTKFIIDKKVR